MMTKKTAAPKKMSFEAQIKKFQELLKKKSEAEVRLYFREKHDLIYVKEYKVKTHMRRRLPRVAVLPVVKKELKQLQLVDSSIKEFIERVAQQNRG